MKKLLAALILMMSATPVFAVEIYNKLYLHGIFKQPYETTVGDTKIDLKFSPIGIELEAGTEVGMLGGNIGISYWDSGADAYYNTKRLEIFYDHYWDFQETFYAKVGMGLKIYGRTVVLEKELIPPHYDTIRDLMTARVEIGRNFDKYAVFLSHHSQWFRGKPFSDDWEYHTTSVGISYKF